MCVCVCVCVRAIKKIYNKAVDGGQSLSGITMVYARLSLILFLRRFFCISLEVVVFLCYSLFSVFNFSYVFFLKFLLCFQLLQLLFCCCCCCCCCCGCCFCCCYCCCLPCSYFITFLLVTHYFDRVFRTT